MARLTAQALMAPGGLLDAGSRLTQTLLTVPLQRAQIERQSRNQELSSLGSFVQLSNQSLGELNNRIASQFRQSNKKLEGLTDEEALKLAVDIQSKRIEAGIQSPEGDLAQVEQFQKGLMERFGISQEEAANMMQLASTAVDPRLVDQQQTLISQRQEAFGRMKDLLGLQAAGSLIGQATPVPQDSSEAQAIVSEQDVQGTAVDPSVVAAGLGRPGSPQPVPDAGVEPSDAPAAKALKQMVELKPQERARKAMKLEKIAANPVDFKDHIFRTTTETNKAIETFNEASNGLLNRTDSPSMAIQDQTARFNSKVERLTAQRAAEQDATKRQKIEKKIQETQEDFNRRLRSMTEAKNKIDTAAASALVAALVRNGMSAPEALAHIEQNPDLVEKAAQSAVAANNIAREDSARGQQLRFPGVASMEQFLNHTALGVPMREMGKRDPKDAAALVFEELLNDFVLQEAGRQNTQMLNAPAMSELSARPMRPMRGDMP